VLRLATTNTDIDQETGTDPGGGGWGDRPPKTNESYFIDHDFVQFETQYSQYNLGNSIRNKT